jgi:hypothetical protein
LRVRYDKPGAVPSEHVKGNAVDIAAFVLADGRRIFVKQQGERTAAISSTLSVCLRLLHDRPRARRKPAHGT